MSVNCYFHFRQRNAGTLFWLWQVQTVEKQDALQGFIQIVTWNANLHIESQFVSLLYYSCILLFMFY